MAAKVEMLIQVCVNGRPIWRMAKPMRAELTTRLGDKEYARVVSAAIFELDAQVGKLQKAEK